MAAPDLKPPVAFYPESDGTPMAETDLHRDLMLESIEAVKHHFRDAPDVYVSGNLFIYYEDGHPESVVSPDFFVVRGVPKGPRRIFKLWEENKSPGVVLELTSRSTHLEDLGNKRAIYEEIGVEEYFIYDPEGIKFQPQLRAWRLRDGILQPMPEVRRGACGAQVFSSEVLGLELHGSKGALRWVDPGTAQPLPIPSELRERWMDEVRRAKDERQRAEAERARADREKQRADASDAENARLREELARLRGK